jgi:HpcH/HpaI aldolase/citrate lyase family protein
MNRPFELFLFSTDANTIREAIAAGVAGVIVDWERAGKIERQRYVDTEINEQTIEDLHAVRAATEAKVLCRINSFGVTTEEEIENAIGAGVDEILLPMVRTVEEVGVTLDLVRQRCGVGILVETVDAVEQAAQLARLPLSRVYVGLNDLMIDRADTSIFTAVLDGTVSRIRSMWDLPFGVAGLTVVDGGWPIPCRLLIAEMARLGCHFTFLRRSFHRDIRGRALEEEIPRILHAMAASWRRSSAAIERDREELNAAICRARFDRTVSVPSLQ